MVPVGFGRQLNFKQTFFKMIETRFGLLPKSVGKGKLHFQLTFFLPDADGVLLVPQVDGVGGVPASEVEGRQSAGRPDVVLQAAGGRPGKEGAISAF